jgi:hypothetical protein
MLSERMRMRNPMRMPGVKERATASLRAMGHKPRVRGGNGCGATVPQALLAKALGWPMEVVVPTRMKRATGFPGCYKLDVANSDLMVGVEVDGGSHASLDRQAQDRKKDAFLSSIGWTVLRFSNEVAMEHLEECVQTVLSTISKLKERTTTSQMAS